MFQLLLVTVLSTGPELPLQIAPPSSIEARGIVAVLQANESWFVAENRSEFEQVLFVASEECGLVPPVSLPPGMRMEWAYPQGMTNDVFVELLSLDASGWQNTGAFLVADLRSVDDGTAWVTDEEPGLAVWARSAGETVQLPPVGEILPETVLAAGGPTLIDYSDDESMLNPIHVPVIVPGGGDVPPDQPPKIEKIPLPPV